MAGLPAWRADRAVYPYGGEGTLAILATDLEFEGSRVKSPILGRDFNPMGRGDGAYYAQGAMAIYNAKPSWVGEITTGWGNSICNGDTLPTATDLGGSPSAGASASGAGECCGARPVIAQAPTFPIGEPPTWEDYCEWGWGFGGGFGPIEPPRIMGGSGGSVLGAFWPGYAMLGEEVYSMSMLSFDSYDTIMRSNLMMPMGESRGGIGGALRRKYGVTGTRIGSGTYCVPLNPALWDGLEMICFHTCTDAYFFHHIFCRVHAPGWMYNSCHTHICGRWSGCREAGWPRRGLYRLGRGKFFVFIPPGIPVGDLGKEGEGENEEDPEGESQTVTDCIEEIIQKYGDSGQNVRWILGQIKQCISNALQTFILCIIGSSAPGARKRCAETWAKDMAKCATKYLEDLPEEIAREVLECFRDYSV